MIKRIFIMYVKALDIIITRKMFYVSIRVIHGIACRRYSSVNATLYPQGSSMSSPSTTSICGCTSAVDAFAAVVSITNLHPSAYSRYSPARYSIVRLGCRNRNFRFSLDHSKYSVVGTTHRQYRRPSANVGLAPAVSARALMMTPLPLNPGIPTFSELARVLRAVLSMTALYASAKSHRCGTSLPDTAALLPYSSSSTPRIRPHILYISRT